MLRFFDLGLRFPIILAATILVVANDEAVGELVVLNSFDTPFATLTVKEDAMTSPGLTRFFFEVEPNVGEIQGIEATFTATAMNQINPLNAATVLEDNNAFIGLVGGNPLDDSQFEFHSMTDTAFNMDGDPLFQSALTVDTSTQLSAVIAGFDPITMPRSIAHVVLPDSTPQVAQANIKLVLATPGGDVEQLFPLINFTQGSATIVPEPSALMLCGFISTLFFVLKKKLA